MIPNPGEKERSQAPLSNSTQAVLDAMPDCQGELKKATSALMDAIEEPLAALEGVLVKARGASVRAAMEEEDEQTRRDLEGADARLNAMLNTVRDVHARFLELGRLSNTYCRESPVIIERATKRGYRAAGEVTNTPTT